MNKTSLAESNPPTVFARKVTTSINIHCGCGFRVTELGKAAEHARTTGHTLHISGEVRSSY